MIGFLNQFHIFGVVVKDLVIRHTRGGVPTVTYMVCVEDNILDGNGNVKSTRDWIPVTTYAEQAIKDAANLRKGSTVAVRGRIKSWYTRDGSKSGFNFEADDNGVIYIAGNTAAPNTETQNLKRMDLTPVQ